MKAANTRQEEACAVVRS